MYFVLKQFRQDGITYERNVRMGGYKSEKSAAAAAVKHAPCLVKDHTRRIIPSLSTVSV